MKTSTLAAAVLAASLFASRASGQYLTVDSSIGNSPYTLNSGTLTDQQLIVGIEGTGVFNQNGGVNVVTGQCYLAFSDTTGTYNLNGGVLEVPYIKGQYGTSTLNFNGGTLEASASSTTFLSNLTAVNVQAGGAIINPNGNTVTLYQTLASGASKDGGLQVVGAGTVIAFGGSYNGPTVISGTLQVGNGTSDGNLGTNTGAVTDNGTLVFNEPDAFSPNAINGSGKVVQAGPGTLYLSATSNYTGGTSVTGGTLSVSSDAALGTTYSGGYDSTNGIVTLSGSGKLLITGTSFATQRTFNLIGANSTITESAGGSMTFQSGAVVNGGALGAGSYNFQGGSALNGTTTRIGSSLSQSGTVAFDGVLLSGSLTQSGTLNATSGLTVDNSGTLTVGGTVNFVSGGESRGVTTVNSGGNINVQANSLYLSGGSRTTINAGGMLSVASGATVELNGALLTNNGTQTGTLNVNYGSTLKGSGTFGTVNVTSGGTFSPGNSPGTAVVQSLSLQSAGSYQFELNSATAANNSPGNHADLISVNGLLTISAGTTADSQFAVNVVSLDGNDNNAALTDFNASEVYRFVLVTSAGISGFNAADFSVNTSGFANSLQGGSFSVVQDGNNLDLVFTPVPEPSTWALLGGGVVGLGLTLRQRRALLV